MIVPNRVLPSLGQVRLADENQVEPLDLRFVSSVLSAREQKNWREKQLQANLYKELRAMQTPAGPENGVGGFTPYNPYMQKAQDAYMNNYNQILDHASQTMDNVKDPLEVEKVLFQGAQKLFTPEYRQAYAQSKQFENYIEEFTKNPKDYDPTEVYNVLNDFYVSQDAFDMSQFRSPHLKSMDLTKVEDDFFKNFKTQKAVEYKDIGGGASGVVKTEFNMDPDEAGNLLYNKVMEDPILAKKYANAGLEGDKLKSYLQGRAAGNLGNGEPIYDKDGNKIGVSRIADITNVYNPKTASEGSSENEREISRLMKENPEMSYEDALRLVKGRESKLKDINTTYTNDPATVFTIGDRQYPQGNLASGTVDADISNWPFWGGLKSRGKQNDGRPRLIEFEAPKPGNSSGMLWTNDPQFIETELGLSLDDVQRKEHKYADNKVGELYGVPATAFNPTLDAQKQTTSINAQGSDFSNYIGYTESQNNYKSNNPLSATGAWGTHNFIWGSHEQEIKELGKQMGYDIQSPQDFLSHPDVQEAYFQYEDETLYTPAIPDMRAAAAQSDNDWIKSLSDDELKYVIHHEGSKQTALNFLRNGKSDYDTMKDKNGKPLNANSTEEIRKGIQRLRDKYDTAGAGKSLFSGVDSNAIPDVPQVAITIGDNPEVDANQLLKKIANSPKGMIQSMIYPDVFLKINYSDPDRPFIIAERGDDGQIRDLPIAGSFQDIAQYMTNAGQ